MPEINLKTFEKTVVNTRTQAEFDELIKIFKDGGWEAFEYTNNLWQTYKEKTSVEVNNDYSVSTIDDSPMYNETVITLDEFKQIQGIESENQMEDVDAKMAEYGVKKIKYKAGDILIDSSGEKKIVLAVTDYACWVSITDDDISLHYGCTQKQLDRNGWKLYTETPKTKLTMQEIADKFGKSVDEIEIESSDENN